MKNWWQVRALDAFNDNALFPMRMSHPCPRRLRASGKDNQKSSQSGLRTHICGRFHHLVLVTVESVILIP